MFPWLKPIFLLTICIKFVHSSINYIGGLIEQMELLACKVRQRTHIVGICKRFILCLRIRKAILYGCSSEKCIHVFLGNSCICHYGLSNRTVSKIEALQMVSLC